LAVVLKIVQDHGGEISVERTSQGRTVFKIVLPGQPPENFRSANGSGAGLRSLVPAEREDTSQNSISHPGP
jgi:nitrogen-specific signal transduction histidine kinase